MRYEGPAPSVSTDIVNLGYLSANYDSLAGNQTITGIKTFSSAISIADGSVGTPAINFTNSPHTGIYSTGTNKIDFSANSTRVGGFDASGNFDLAVGLLTISSGRISQLYTDTTLSGTVVNAYFHSTVNPASASTTTFYGSRSEINSGGSQNLGTLIGHLGYVSVNTIGTVTAAIGLQALVATTASINTPITSATGLSITINNSGTGTITNAFGVRVLTPVGTITTNYGIKVEDQIVGGTNYSLYTGIGNGSLGDDFTFRQVSTPGAPTIGTPTAGGNIDAGAHLWKVTFLTNTSFNRGETLLSAASGSFTIVGGTQTMPLTIPVSADSRVIARRIYRTKAGGSIYYQVGQVNDNTTTTFSDTFADSTLTLTSPSLSTSVGFTGTLRATAIYATNGRSVLEAESDLQLVLRRTNTATGAIGLTAIGDRDSAVTYSGFRINNMDASDIVAGSKYIQFQFLDAGTTGSLNISTSGVGGNTNFSDTTASTTTVTGTATFGGGIGIAGAWNAGANCTLTGTSNSNLIISITNSSNGASATSRIGLVNDANNSLNSSIGSSGNTSTLFGITTANYAYLHASGSTIAGLLIGINGSANVPIVFGTNNIEVARFTSGTLSTGSLSLSYTTASVNTITGSFITPGGIGAGGAINAGASSSVSASSSGTSVQFLIQNTNSAATSSATLAVQNDSTATGRVNAYSSSNGGTIFGISTNNAVLVGANGASLTNLLIGQTQSASIPMIFGLGSSEVARFTNGTLSTGSLTLAYTTPASNSLTGGLILTSGVGVNITATTTSGALGGLFISQNNTPASASTTTGYGALIQYNHLGTQNQGTNDITGIFSLVTSGATAGTVTTMMGLKGSFRNTSTGAVTAGYCLYALAPTNSGGGTVNTAYGVYVDPITIGSTNYAFYSNSGLFRVGDTTISTSSGNGSVQLNGSLSVQLANITTTSNTTNYGIITQATHNPGAASSATIIATYSQMQFNGTGANTGTTAIAIQGDVSKTSTANITSLIGGKFTVSNSNATGTVTSGYGLYVDTPVTTGAITTVYGLYINTQSGGGTNYSIFTAGAGKVKISDTTDSTGSSSDASVRLLGGLSVALSIFATTYSGALASACTATTQAFNNNTTAVATTAYSDRDLIAATIRLLMRV